jgi:hypothetical protein
MTKPPEVIAKNMIAEKINPHGNVSASMLHTKNTPISLVGFPS